VCGKLFVQLGLASRGDECSQDLLSPTAATGLMLEAES
jgi:hypothetical protein